MLPKLEFTAASCVVQLQKYVLQSLKLNIQNVYLWTERLKNITVLGEWDTYKIDALYFQQDKLNIENFLE